MKEMHVYLRTTSQSVVNMADWPMARSWCGQTVAFHEVCNLRGSLSGVKICEACANAIEHDKP